MGNAGSHPAQPSRTLHWAAMGNLALWVLSIVGLIFVMQRCPSAKGLFVLLVAGLGASSSVLALARRTAA